MVSGTLESLRIVDIKRTFSDNLFGPPLSQLRTLLPRVQMICPASQSQRVAKPSQQPGFLLRSWAVSPTVPDSLPERVGITMSLNNSNTCPKQGRG